MPEKAKPHQFTRFEGVKIIVLTLLVAAMFVYATVISKLMPITGHWLLDAVREDHYYCYLIPLTVPTALFAIYLNWLSMNFFRNNP